MLLIRDEQLEIFRQHATHQVELRLVEHVRRFFSIQARALGHDLTLRVVRVGMKRSQLYGLTRERDVFAFIDFMFTLSFDFDRNPAIPWAHHILADQRKSADRRIKRLRRTVLCFLQHHAANEVR